MPDAQWLVKVDSNQRDRIQVELLRTGTQLTAILTIDSREPFEVEKLILTRNPG